MCARSSETAQNRRRKFRQYKFFSAGLYTRQANENSFHFSNPSDYRIKHMNCFTFFRVKSGTKVDCPLQSDNIYVFIKSK